MTAAMGFCDRCGRRIGPRQGRYVLRVEVFAAPDGPEIQEQDLARDLEAELARLQEELALLEGEQALEDVYREFRFVLCRDCQRSVLRAPLATIGRGGEDRPQGRSS